MMAVKKCKYNQLIPKILILVIEINIFNQTNIIMQKNILT